MSDKMNWSVSPGAGTVITRERARAEQRRAEQAARRARREAQRKNAAAWNRKKRRVNLAGDEVLLVSNEQRTFVRARLDDGYPPFFGGYGGWEDEPRPGQVSATVYRGTRAPQLRLSLILGGWPYPAPWGADCDRDIRMLDHYARLPLETDGEERPTLLRVMGKVPHHHRRWFIQNLQWGEVDVYRGQRVRALVTVTLRMYVPVELLKRKDRAARPTRVHVFRRGERFDRLIHEALAVRGAGELSWARKVVLDLNDMRLGAKPRVGQRLKLPVGGWWRKGMNRR
ncbi:hypothetical protein Q5424_09375 [Conexibacter sp. JD483]|uniref:hypothetical protein n=1 Tax=unclassified Conexibacter TaxID=2627773 RepID=UPI0027164398|nr:MULTISPECIES: hypothetical protein [unclassified Conexibacter]MDO8187213.1 hypothetical protein [Conexibacter sp. CPCC 205706]MDO8199310.1 hypothetical protein [Conexibacter sp. CPCC 205762]MDR9369289.1 hypothetical protein [Conexibacter sp. JD483]